jgi:hypothetical protein
VFALCADWRPPSGEITNAYLTFFLAAHKVRLGQGWFGQAGLAFAGTPGMSVGRIHREDALAQFLTDVVGGQDAGFRRWAAWTRRVGGAQERRVRLGAGHPASAAAPAEAADRGPGRLARGVVRADLPVAVADPLGLAFVVGLALGDPGLGPRLMGGLKAALGTAAILVVPLLIVLGLLYLSLRARRPATGPPTPRPAAPCCARSCAARTRARRTT